MLAGRSSVSTRPDRDRTPLTAQQFSAGVVCSGVLDICLFCFFFFQAEDGIRDLTVTGVQTCALPISSLAHRFVAMIEHERHRLPERVAYITSPGNGNGSGYRKRAGLPRGGPAAVITTDRKSVV